MKSASLEESVLVLASLLNICKSVPLSNDPTLNWTFGGKCRTQKSGKKIPVSCGFKFREEAGCHISKCLREFQILLTSKLSSVMLGILGVELASISQELKEGFVKHYFLLGYFFLCK